MNPLVSSLVFAAWAAAVAVCDCRSRRVPNALVAVGLIAALAFALVHGNPFGLTPARALAGAVVGLVALMPFFALGVMGAADVKVFAVLGAWCGVDALPGLWVAASLAAGVHAVALLFTMRGHTATSGPQTSPGIVLRGTRGTPYVACLAVPAIAWLALHTLHLTAGAAR
jgi:prepilin peptidase CpaA